MPCRNCQHSSYDHGEYEYLPRPTYPEARLTRVSERCGAAIYESLSGDELGRKCDCPRYEKPEEETIEAG